MSGEATVALVVDDDLLVRRLVMLSLEHAGLRCVGAASADAALRIAQELHAQLSVLVTDVEMPGTLDGIGLAATIAAWDPAIPVIVMSSEPAQLARAHGLQSVAATLGKPFAPGALRQAVALATRRHHPRTWVALGWHAT